MTLPNAFIIGAPKCGTSSLAVWLGEHPDIFLSAIKEPHYFADDLTTRSVSSLRRYKRLFEAAPEAALRIEASTWYLYSKTAIRNIEEAVDDARYVVLVRDPIDMAVSLFHHNRRTLNEDSATLEEAWKKQFARADGQELPRRCRNPEFLQYRDACSLKSMITDLYAQVSPSRVLVVSLEQLKSDPRQAYVRVLNHFGLPDDQRTDFPVHNRAREARLPALHSAIRAAYRLKRRVGVNRSFGVARMNEFEIEKPVLSQAFRHELQTALQDQRVCIELEA